jgi:hypothetical protein
VRAGWATSARLDALYEEKLFEVAAGDHARQARERVER